MVKRALITGITGQDGAYLAKFLLNKKYKVYGIYRRNSSPNFWRLQEVEVFDKIKLIPADMSDMASLLEAVTVSRPHEIYNLAAQSYVEASFDQPLLTAEVDGTGALRILEIIRHINPKIKYYQASTSELYGTVTESSQNEETKFSPNSPYASAKLYSYHNARIYRDAYGIFACNGILFNHESPLRGMEFVTRKITNAVARIKLGLQKDLLLGNLEAKRDWGFAKDFVEAMWAILQYKKPDDFVVSTGEAHSVKEFAEESFNAVGLNWKDYVKTNKLFIRPLDVHYLCGDHSKITKELGWKPKVTFRELVQIMINADMERWKKHLDGKTFPWDAPSYPGDLNSIKRNLKNK